MSILLPSPLITRLHVSSPCDPFSAIHQRLAFSPSPSPIWQTRSANGSLYRWDQSLFSPSNKTQASWSSKNCELNVPKLSKPSPSNRRQQLVPEKIHLAALEDVGDLDHLNRVDKELTENGIAVVSLGFEDPESKYLTRLVVNLGKQKGHGPPTEHNSSQGWLWDVRPNSFNKRAAAERSSTAQDTLTPPDRRKVARSETMEEFPWHTDCSWEPPQYFALHVLQADRCGGGATSLLALGDIMAMCTKETLYTLSQPEFAFAVPEEFREEAGKTHVVGAILWNKPLWRIRFRADTTKPLTTRAEKALKELSGLLEEESRLKESSAEDVAQGRSLICKPSFLTNGSVVLVDNTRWLHSRNHVADPERHLRRIRWSALSVK